MSITRINHFEAAPGQSGALWDFLRGVNKLVKAAPGCEACQLLQDHDDPQRFVVLETWASVAAHQAAAEAIPPAMVAKVLPLLAGKPSGSYYQGVD